jgi:hypothetical protein
MNVFQLNSPSLWIYFALSIPLLIFIIILILFLKAGVLYAQSGQTQLGFFRWLISGRPMAIRSARADLENGGLRGKLRDRLKGPDWQKQNNHHDEKEE